ncbi:HK97-gp10 family putative phage morphogenesis protein [Alkalihalophilus marmarensis]|uniref:HK97-gp10 family putative phage morphogenesis protein n=1 Tax=Alkalihalophilus marmarensis TaxID=521377 RepID=UPI002E1C5AEB|nr:HK97 gp10 family phage protein [Alkalihalophilus marmarensis]
MDKFKFEFEGIDDLLRTLEQSSHDVEKAKEDALLAGAKVMQEETKKAAETVLKRRSGTLIGNIEISDVEGDEVSVYVDNQGKAYYGHMHEFGTSKMPARPFMGPAFNRSGFKINKALADKLKQTLRW